MSTISIASLVDPNIYSLNLNIWMCWWLPAQKPCPASFSCSYLPLGLRPLPPMSRGEMRTRGGVLTVWVLFLIMAIMMRHIFKHHDYQNQERNFNFLKYNRCLPFSCPVSRQPAVGDRGAASKLEDLEAQSSAAVCESSSYRLRLSLGQ